MQEVTGGWLMQQGISWKARVFASVCVCGTSIWRFMRGGFLWLENVPCLEMPGAGHIEAWNKFYSENVFYVNHQLPMSQLV